MPISTSNPVPPAPLGDDLFEGKFRGYSPSRSGPGPVPPVADHVDVDDAGEEPGEDPRRRTPDGLVGELVELHRPVGTVDAPRPALLVVHRVGEELAERDVE